MIAIHQEPRKSSGQRQVPHYNFSRLGNYCRDASHQGEKCLMSWYVGCNAPDYDLALEEIKATQALNVRVKRDKTYHLEISFWPEDEAKLTPEAYQRIECAFAEALGLSEHQRVCGVHKNTAHLHMHIAYNLIHPEKLTIATTLFYDYAKLSKVCRAMEQEYGLVVDNGYEQRQTQEAKISQRAAALEAHSGELSFQSWALLQKDAVMRRMETAKTWQDAKGILADYGMALQPRANGLVLVPLEGKGSLKASAFDKSMSKMRMEKRFGAFVESEIPSAVSRPELEPLAAEQKEQSASAAEEKTFQEAVLGRKAQILEQVQAAQNWQELHQVLAEHGLTVKPMGNGLVFADASGETVKASAIDRSLSKAKLEAKLGAYIAPEVRQQAPDREEKPGYHKRPRQRRSPERDELYKSYQAALAEKIARIDEEKARNQGVYEHLKDRLQAAKANLYANTYSRRTRAARLRILRDLYAKDFAQEKLNHKAAMAEIKANYTWYNWNTWLQDQVKKGNGVALAVLRSQEERKAAQAAIRHPAQEKTRLAVAPGERLARLAGIEATRVKLGGALESYFAGHKYRIDNRGVVIIKLASGGIIRDTGDKLYFSQEADTRQAARLYGQAKFGKIVKEKENSIERRTGIGRSIARLFKPNLGVLRDAARNGVCSLSKLNVVFGSRQKQPAAKVFLPNHARDDMER